MAQRDQSVKLFGFYFILKGFYFTEINYGSEHGAKQKSMSVYTGLFFQLRKDGSKFICTAIDGELLQRMGYDQGEFKGRPISEILPFFEASMNDYCQLTKKLQDDLTFEMVCQDKVLLISIKPSVDEFGQDVILGTALDMTGVFPQRVNPKQKRHEENTNFKIVM